MKSTVLSTHTQSDVGTYPEQKMLDRKQLKRQVLMAQGFKRSSCPATRMDAHTLGSLLDDQKKRVIRRNQLAANVVTEERLDTPGRVG